MPVAVTVFAPSDRGISTDHDSRYSSHVPSVADAAFPFTDTPDAVRAGSVSKVPRIVISSVVVDWLGVVIRTTGLVYAGVSPVSGTPADATPAASTTKSHLGSASVIEPRLRLAVIPVSDHAVTGWISRWVQAAHVEAFVKCPPFIS